MQIERRWRLAAAVFLYLATVLVFAGSGSGSHVYRYDCGAAVAHPASDARNAYASALAVLEGDGWANWQTSSRWTLCKIGWKAVLVPLAWAFERDPERMQLAVTAGLAVIGPAFYVLACAMLRFPFGGFAAFAATVAFLAYPLDRTWWFTRTFMTEGPTLLLALVFCGLALGEVRRRHWRGEAGLVLGLVGGALALVRSQARFGVVGVLLIVALAATRSAAGRRFLVASAVGVLAVVVPVYAKTSIHLGRPYLGTEICSLRAVLHWTASGRAAGGAWNLPAVASTSETAIADELSARVRRALASQLEHPVAVAKFAADRFLFATFGPLAHALDRPWSSTAAAVAALALGLGVGAAWRHHGVAAAIPVVFAGLYFLPHASFSLFWVRHGVPISWLGVLSLASLPLFFVRPTPSAPAPDRSPRRWIPLLLATALVSAGATVAMLRSDLAPAPHDAAAVILEPGENPFPEGHLLLPVVVRPGDPACNVGDAVLEPRERTYTSFLLATSWKRDGEFTLRRVAVPGTLPAGLRPGTRVRAPAPEPH